MKISGFTLVELLIVVAIIAILAAIAVPNFLQAQTRAKVSRCKAEFRSIATAVESYEMDDGHYPTGTLGDTFWNLASLTTPIAYMTSVTFEDPFKPVDLSIGNSHSSYLYYNYKSPGMYSHAAAAKGQGSFIVQAVSVWITAKRAPKLWLITSLGRDRSFAAMSLVPVSLAQRNIPDALARYYDPTNGTVSYGDIGRLGGQLPAGASLPE